MIENLEKQLSDIIGNSIEKTTKHLLMQIYDPNRRPYKLYRNKKGWPAWYQRWIEAWWCITGKYTFHIIWQRGLDEGSLEEYRRIVINGGDGKLIPHEEYEEYLDFKAKRDYK